MAKRCSPCNKSKHYQCHQGQCICKCQEYSDTVTQAAEPERQSDPANDDFIQELNDKFNARNKTT